MTTERQVINRIIQILGDEILLRATENLSSLEFAQKKIMAVDVNSPEPYDKTEPRNWTITNTGVLAKTGFFDHDKKELKGTVGFGAPYAYSINFGQPPHTLPFPPIYEWAYKRRAEVLDLLKKSGWLHWPSKKRDPRIYQMYSTYVNTSLEGPSKVSGLADKYAKGRTTKRVPTERNYDDQVFLFAYYTWSSITNTGVQPSFFFSDAVTTVAKDAKRLIAQGLRKMEGVKVEG